MSAAPTSSHDLLAQQRAASPVLSTENFPVNTFASDHSQHKEHPLSHKLIFWGGLAALGLVIAPHLLPAIGIGEATADFVGPVCFPGTAKGSGIAGSIGNFLKDTVPFIGEEIAKGGWATAVASSSIGIGGVLLGNFIGKHEDNTRFIKWGGVIKVAALATSFLVSLPALLPALALGISFIGSLGLEATEALGKNAYDVAEARNNLVNNVVNFLGTAPAGANSAASGLSSTSAVWAHAATCGGTVGALNFASKKAVTSGAATSMKAPDFLEGALPQTHIENAEHQNKLAPKLSKKAALTV